MRYGYWLPMFGGWLRNVEDEGMEASWEYVSRLARRSEEIGFDLTLLAELNLNDIKGPAAPALDAWSTAAALAAVTRRLELMVAVRPTYHHPAMLAKQAANIARIAPGRLALNVVSAWWREEALQFGIPFDQHDDRYARTGEWLDVVDGLWRQPVLDYDGNIYRTRGALVSPRPAAKPAIYAGGESEAAKNLIARKADAYVMHGDSPAVLAARIADMRLRREQLAPAAPPLQFGVAGYVILRDSERSVEAERKRITNVRQNAAGYANYQSWLANTKLEQHVSHEDYSVSNRGLRTGLLGTASTIQARIEELESVGVDLLLLQFSPQYEEMERFAAEIITSETIESTDAIEAAPGKVVDFESRTK